MYMPRMLSDSNQEVVFDVIVTELILLCTSDGSMSLCVLIVKLIMIGYINVM